MSIQNLFNSNGDQIAYRIDENIFNLQGERIGWMPWDNKDVVTQNGKYLGSITEENRFYYIKKNRRHRYNGYPPYLNYPDYPSYSDYPNYPEYIGQSSLPHNIRDVIIPVS